MQREFKSIDLSIPSEGIDLGTSTPYGGDPEAHARMIAAEFDYPADTVAVLRESHHHKAGRRWFVDQRELGRWTWGELRVGRIPDGF